MLVLAGQANEAEATAVSDEIVAAMNAQPERYAFVVVMDLAGVPEFGRGLSVAIVRERLEREDQLLAARLEQGGQTFKPPLRLQLPDWSGQATRFWLAAIPEAGYAVFRAPEGHTRFERDRLRRERQRLRSEVQVFVLDEKHELKAQYVGRSAGARAIEAMRTLQPHSPAALGNLQ
ncbi:hypothetical protein GKIL_3082 [Gloeobacter kilaueensis JS1]|uniref:Uncharacterized protein n=1 Tax=Gloeobacter kilaueensis (strain ATCC BAA-2537 / CCAP 1431/1 / ULC 316 / JS1) TaxID=1183438 RepID=U5QKE7_GLOK1|nr:hypothetical protein GKIL_3082 [Gloeobacter kilaueensis JS1]